ncbi:MAG: hypothetical protein J6X59_01055 [Bacteroidales bacterium]|nr:hypothetical protein [Bacteroidales bacterium]
MIAKNEAFYLDYTKDVENWVDSICKKYTVIPSTVDSLRSSIFAKTCLLSIKATGPGLIPKNEWEQTKQDIEVLCQKLREYSNSKL